ncbi:outer membrane protein assembly factor BamB family protein [Phytohabitans rumicis]|uniref:Pyrrolo-quinoline quinone repeat domain-containing protein n=1 Tax=Phytohabitans rumicis TaxID=1076125 RepID=A0A6V8LMN5_9ACTN|nr:PQQ-binding-like beta-propeller repeat protein [Phytohabitans rumicis]GFJ96281.1 hypothetical protein Prum_099230 [Phytohabitans rumicis]
MVQRRHVLKGAAATAVGLSVTPASPAAAASGMPACGTPGGRDFPKVGGNLGNQNYSALSRVHRGNVSRLGGAWLNQIEGGVDTGTNQSTAVAVDGATGATKWTYQQTRGTLTRRGVAVGQGMVFTHGRGSWLIALDQETGQVVWEKQVTGYGSMEKVAVTYHDGMLYCGTHDSPRAAALTAATPPRTARAVAGRTSSPTPSSRWT